MAECRITVAPSRTQPGTYDVRRVERGQYGARFADGVRSVPVRQVMPTVEQMKRQPSIAFRDALGAEHYVDISVRLPAGFDSHEQRAMREPNTESRDTRATS